MSEIKTCKRGHPRTEDNTYTNPQGKSFCKVCRRENVAKHRQQKKDGEHRSQKEGDYCLKGHRRTQESTYIDEHGHKHCRTCGRAANRRRYREEHGISPDSPLDYRTGTVGGRTRLGKEITKCAKAGHDLNDPNSYYMTRGRKVCKICANKQAKERYRKKKKK